MATPTALAAWLPGCLAGCLQVCLPLPAWQGRLVARGSRVRPGPAGAALLDTGGQTCASAHPAMCGSFRPEENPTDEMAAAVVACASVVQSAMDSALFLGGARGATRTRHEIFFLPVVARTRHSRGTSCGRHKGRRQCRLETAAPRCSAGFFSRLRHQMPRLVHPLRPGSTPWPPHDTSSPQQDAPPPLSVRAHARVQDREQAPPSRASPASSSCPRRHRPQSAPRLQGNAAQASSTRSEFSRAGAMPLWAVK